MKRGICSWSHLGAVSTWSLQSVATALSAVGVLAFTCAVPVSDAYAQSTEEAFKRATNAQKVAKRARKTAGSALSSAMSAQAVSQALSAQVASVTGSLNELKVTVNAAQGVAGPKGDTGPMGPQGPAGPTGAMGPMGPAGPQGEAGAAGARGATGPQGPQGAQGQQGPAGATGARGATGPQGPAGAQGPQGPVGPAGAMGPQGPAGPTGPQGTVAATNIPLVGPGQCRTVNLRDRCEGAFGCTMKTTHSNTAGNRLVGTNHEVRFRPVAGLANTYLVSTHSYDEGRESVVGQAGNDHQYVSTSRETWYLQNHRVGCPSGYQAPAQLNGTQATSRYLDPFTFTVRSVEGWNIEVRFEEN